MKTFCMEDEMLLLEKIHRAGTVETFTYFPDIIQSGTTTLEPEDLDYIRKKGYLVERRQDSFGSIYGLSPLGEKCIKESFQSNK